MSGKLTSLPPHERMSVADCLAMAGRDAPKYSDVMVIGYDRNGALVITSSQMSRKDAVWMLLEALDFARDKT